MRAGPAIAAMLIGAALAASGAASRALAFDRDMLPGFVPPPPKPPEKPPPPVEPSTPADACKDATVLFDEGVVSIELKNPALADKTIAYRLGKFTTTAVSGADGHALLPAPLFTDRGVFEWNVDGAAPCEREVTFPNYRNAFVFAISWVEPNDIGLDLDLHAVEPASAIGAASGYVSRTHPTGNAGTLGLFRAFGRHEPGAMRIQYYSIPSFRSIKRGIYTFRVEFTSRQDPPVPPFCRGDAHERAAYHVYKLLHGELRETNAAFGARECGRGFKDPTLAFARFEMVP